MRRLTNKEIHNRINKYNWIWVGGVYKDRRSLLTLNCSNRHTLKRSLSKLTNDNGYCHKCKRNNDDVAQIEKAMECAVNRNGILLSKKYLGYHSKHEWKCLKGHAWFSTFYSVVCQNTWCPLCSHNKKLTIEDAHKIAKEKGGSCLSDEYLGAHKLLKWQCGCGFVWSTSLDSVKNNKTWCPKCNGGNYIDINFVRKYIESKAGKCLSDQYINGRATMNFECKGGHVWATSFRSIYNNKTWCPACAQISSKSQNKLMEILKSIYKDYEIRFNYRGFDWLRTSKHGKQEIDLWLPKLKLAIEYDGEQHFKPMRFGSKQDMTLKLKKIQKRDRLKNRKIKQHTEDIKYFIRIKYTEKLDTENIVSILIKNGVPVSEII